MRRALLDSAYILGLEDRTDPLHVDALAVRDCLRRNGYLMTGREQVVPDLVLLETTQELLHRKGFSAARDVRRRVLAEHTVARTSFRDVEVAFDEICSKFGHSVLGGRGLGLVDAVSVLVMRREKVGWILSPDHGFDPVPALRRIWTHNVEETCLSVR